MEPELKRTCAANRSDGLAAGMRAVDKRRVAAGRETALRRNMVAEVESERAMEKFPNPSPGKIQTSYVALPRPHLGLRNVPCTPPVSGVSSTRMLRR